MLPDLLPRTTSGRKQQNFTFVMLAVETPIMVEESDSRLNIFSGYVKYPIFTRYLKTSGQQMMQRLLSFSQPPAQYYRQRP